MEKEEINSYRKGLEKNKIMFDEKFYTILLSFIFIFYNKIRFSKLLTWYFISLTFLNGSLLHPDKIPLPDRLLKILYIFQILCNIIVI